MEREEKFNSNIVIRKEVFKGYKNINLIFKKDFKTRHLIINKNTLWSEEVFNKLKKIDIKTNNIKYPKQYNLYDLLIWVEKRHSIIKLINFYKKWNNEDDFIDLVNKEYETQEIIKILKKYNCGYSQMFKELFNNINTFEKLQRFKQEIKNLKAREETLFKSVLKESDY